FLVERQLISRELAASDGPRGVAFDDRESVSLMINEEDQLRLQVMRSGFALDEAWQDIDRVDDLLEQRVSYAFSEEFGYLTACPTNVGTGMRASVMLHLPALGLTRQIEKVFRALQKINLGLLNDITIPAVNELFIHTQPAHLQKLMGASLDGEERNAARARYLRTRLREAGPTPN